VGPGGEQAGDEGAAEGGGGIGENEGIINVDKDDIVIEDLSHTETNSLMPLLKSLADHHNKTSINFKGIYPQKSFEELISEITENIKDGYSKINIARKNGGVIGFCQYSIDETVGIFNFLVILPEYRNLGYGSILMDKALEYFETQQVKKIEIKIVYGNDEAVRFYEKYGFKIKSQIMTLIKEQERNDN
jgi:ribosomal protein S18 acetylase RimI-like enzyme